MVRSLEEQVQESEGAPTRTLHGWVGGAVTTVAIGLSLYSLYWVLFIVQPQIYRVSFLLVALVLTFLLFPSRRGAGGQPSLLDWALATAAIVALAWPLVDFSRFVYRAADPLPVDVVLGVTTIALVLEATRRAVGPILPVTALAFLAYAYFGPVFDRLGLPLLAHRGYAIDRLAGTLYMTLEGVFGVPLDVAATYIVLFTIYGAILEFSGAGTFFINWALALMGKSRSGAAPGRTVRLAGFLLGTVSGSGVATTVMLGSVSWPLLRRAGYKPEAAGAILSAAGIGALLSPPTLGAAAFLIAEFLKISYLDVLLMATVPTLLYYLSLFLMVELDTRKFGMPNVAVAVEGQLWLLTKRYWYHFVSLVAIVAFMVWGFSPMLAVFWATVVTFAVSFLRRDTAMGWRKLIAALRDGSAQMLNVAATCAAAGIIVGVVAKTGLGLKFSAIVIAYAGGSLFLTTLFTALIVWVIGLAVPVTASYIICAVIAAPALTKLGVPAFAAHMFIFYYAVLSEVSPPTALSPFAAAAITGADPYRTTLQAWKYTLPAFVVPFVFVLDPSGVALLLKSPAQASWMNVAWIGITACV